MNRLFIIALSAAVLSACGGDGPKQKDPDATIPDKKVDYSKLEVTPLSTDGLVLVDEATVVHHVNNGLRMQVANGGNNILRKDVDGVAVPQAPSADAGQAESNGADGSGSGFSETNVHVQGVDEADYAKYDGSHWYIATQPGGSLNVNDRKPGLKIYATDPAVPEAVSLGKYNYDDQWGAVGEIYTVSKEGETSHIAAIRNQWGNVRPFLPGRGLAISRFEGVLVDVAVPSVDVLDAPDTSIAVEPNLDIEPAIAVSKIAFWPGHQNSTVKVELVDVENPNNPQADWSIELDGSLIQSRKVGNTLYMVTRFDPWLKGLAYEYGDLTVREDNEKLLVDANIEALFPSYRIGKSEVPLTKNCYVQSGIQKVHGLASLVHITAIDLGAQKVISSQCLNANVEALSMSTKSLYLTGSVYKNQTSSTVIHKFDLTESGVDYAASGAVQGTVGWRSDPVFRMHEHDNQFRIVTSQWSKAGPEHQLTILEPKGKTLVEMSTLPNKANPAPIGKPREDIYSVRFEGDKAYIVTFRQTDPLYAIDLSDPKNPVVTGELEIPGFATYMHPVGEGYLFTFGQDADENGRTKGLKAELIDVQGDTPEVVSSFILGGRGSQSVALNDLRAFSFQKAGDDNLRVAIPVRIQTEAVVGIDEKSAPVKTATGVQLFTITDISGGATMKDAGMVVVSEGGNYLNRGRTVLHDDALFINYGNDVWVAPWSAPKDLEKAKSGEPTICTAVVLNGLSVTVELDNQYGMDTDACDAKVEVMSSNGDGFSEVLQSMSSNTKNSCTFSGVAERAGNYRISASLPRFNTATRYTTIYRDDCHVIPEEVEMTLKSQEPKICTTEARPSINLALFSEDESIDLCSAKVYVNRNGKNYSLELLNEGLLDGAGEVTDSVINSAGDDVIRLLPPVERKACYFQGPFELSGEMILVIDHPDYDPVEEPVDVQRDECHVQTLKLQATIDPENDALIILK